MWALASEFTEDWLSSSSSPIVLTSQLVLILKHRLVCPKYFLNNFFFGREALLMISSHIWCVVAVPLSKNGEKWRFVGFMVCNLRISVIESWKHLKVIQSLKRSTLLNYLVHYLFFPNHTCSGMLVFLTFSCWALIEFNY